MFRRDGGAAMNPLAAKEFGNGGPF